MSRNKYHECEPQHCTQSFHPFALFLHMYEQSLPKLAGSVMATGPHFQLDVEIENVQHLRTETEIDVTSTNPCCWEIGCHTRCSFFNTFNRSLPRNQRHAAQQPKRHHYDSVPVGWLCHHPQTTIVVNLSLSQL